MTQAALDYLHSRGYPDELIRIEGVETRAGGLQHVGEHQIKAESDLLVFQARSMSGQLIGYQTRTIAQKRYLWLQAKQAHHLPILYAQPDDYELLYQTGDVTLTEGLFDRIALKVQFPRRAVMARLSKGAANQLAVFLKRYATRLWLAFDMDEPGQTASEVTTQRLREHMEVLRLDFPAKDPSSLLERVGPIKLKELFQRQYETGTF